MKLPALEDAIKNKWTFSEWVMKTLEAMAKKQERPNEEIKGNKILPGGQAVVGHFLFVNNGPNAINAMVEPPPKTKRAYVLPKKTKRLK